MTRKIKPGYKLVKGLFGKLEEIPEDWKISNLTHNDVLGLSSGESISNIQTTGSYPVYGSNGVIGYTNQYNDDDSILIGRVGASGSIHYLDHQAWVTDNVLISKVGKMLEKKFCFYALVHLNLEQFATKSAQPLLTQSILKIVKMKIPPIAEQQKIASILSGVDAAIETTQEVIKKTENLKRGLMQRLLTKGIGHTKFKRVKVLFGRYEEIPEDWQVKKIADIGKIVGGGTPSSKNREYWDGDVLWAVPTDITKLSTTYISDTERKITKKGLDNSSAKLLPISTILLTSRATIGECAITTKPMATNQGFQSLVCNNVFDNVFMFYLIKFNRNTIIRLSYGTTFLEISKKEITKTLVPAPNSMFEQTKIASILSGVDAIHNLFSLTKTRTRLAMFLMFLRPVVP